MARLIKAEAEVAVAQILGKTVTACAERIRTNSSIAFATGTAFHGDVRINKVNKSRSASVTLKRGLAGGASQVTTAVGRSGKEQDVIELTGVTFTSLESENANVEFTGYQITYTP